MTDKDMRQLGALDDLAKRASAESSDFRKAADDLFEKVVDEIQEREGCDRRHAYGLAAHDKRAQHMYALSLEKHDQEIGIRTTVGR